MDVQSHFKRLIALLSKGTVQLLRAEHGLHEMAFQKLFITRLCAQYKSLRYDGFGASTSRLESILKAIAELGESIVVDSNGLGNRSAIAGHLSKRSAELNAKSEAIEHDALLYHYINRVPMKLLHGLPIYGVETNARAYKMSSASDEFYSVFVTDFNKSSECLVYGSATSSSMVEALRKAEADYALFRDLHSRRSDWCGNVFSSEDAVIKQHHNSSRDSRNLEILARILEEKDHVESRPTQRLNWNLESLTSPFLGFCYTRCTSQGLYRLSFEKSEDSSQLLHPFW